MLVEEEEVLDPHQSAALRCTGDKTVEYACRGEGLEACCGSRPGTCRQCEGLEEEDDG